MFAAPENGYKLEKPEKEDVGENPATVEENVNLHDGTGQEQPHEATVPVEELAAGRHQNDDVEQPSSENEKPKTESGDGKEDPKGDVEEPFAEGDGSGSRHESGSSTETISKKMEVPNNKVICSFFVCIENMFYGPFGVVGLFLFCKALRNLCIDRICDRSLVFVRKWK